MMRIVAALTILPFVFWACGTAVYSHRVLVFIDDPGGRLGSPPFEVSVFDRQMGYSEDWARRTMGTTSPDHPYTTTLASQGGATFFGPSRPRQVVVSIAVPRLDSTGFLVLVIEPAEHASGVAGLGFTPWGDYSPINQTTPARARYMATPAPRGWDLEIHLEVPPAPAR